jgi:hypothetical protein
MGSQIGSVDAIPSPWSSENAVFKFARMHYLFPALLNINPKQQFVCSFHLLTSHNPMQFGYLMVYFNSQRITFLNLHASQLLCGRASLIPDPACGARKPSSAGAGGARFFALRFAENIDKKSRLFKEHEDSFRRKGRVRT